MAEITHLLLRVAAGDNAAQADLVEVAYEELRDLAQAQMRKERSGHTLQPTALVHEALIRMLGSESAEWSNRAHFFGAAAQAMRRVLIDHARSHIAAKRGGSRQRVDLEAAMIIADQEAEGLLSLDEALERLALMDQRQARVVELRYFGGFTVGEVADALDVSEKTVKRDWALARAWLGKELSA